MHRNYIVLGVNSESYTSDGITSSPRLPCFEYIDYGYALSDHTYFRAYEPSHTYIESRFWNHHLASA